MKNALKFGLLTVCLGLFLTGCFGCGDGDKGGKRPQIDSDSLSKQKHVDSPGRAGVDTTKKDTIKK